MPPMPIRERYYKWIARAARAFSLSLGQRLAMRAILRYNKSKGIQWHGSNPEKERLRDGEIEAAGGHREL